jgi:hypothetical protein
LIKDEVKTWEVKYFFLVFQQIQLGHEVWVYLLLVKALKRL